MIDKRDIKTSAAHVAEDFRYMVAEMREVVEVGFYLIFNDIKFLFDGTIAGARRAEERLWSGESFQVGHPKKSAKVMPIRPGIF